MTITFRLTDQHEPDVDALGQMLSDHNAAAVGPSDMQALAVLANDASGSLIAGLYGYTAWGWLYIRWLWVEDAFRGHKIASTLLEQAETEAKARGCKGAHIDTFNAQALRLYQHHGYQIFGELPDFVDGRTRSFLQKRWPSPTPLKKKDPT